jgi:hypothetical protein
MGSARVDPHPLLLESCGPQGIEGGEALTNGIQRYVLPNPELVNHLDIPSPERKVVLSQRLPDGSRNIEPAPG